MVDVSNNTDCSLCGKKGTFSVAFLAKDEGTLRRFCRIVCEGCFYEGIKDLLLTEKFAVDFEIYRM